MTKKLVPYDGRQYLEIDQVALRRTAKELLAQISFEVGENDPYKIKSRLMPIIDSAIRGEIATPFRERTELIGGLFDYEYGEGTLPSYLAGGFQRAFVSFAVIALGWPLDVPIVEHVNGVQMAWIEFEEEGERMVHAPIKP